MKSTEMQGNKIGICMSGGLSCLTMSRWMAERGLPTLNFVADIGQMDQEDVGSLVRLPIEPVATPMRFEIDLMLKNAPRGAPKSLQQSPV